MNISNTNFSFLLVVIKLYLYNIKGNTAQMYCPTALAFPANPPNASEVIGTIIKDAIINPITGYTNPLYKEINRVS